MKMAAKGGAKMFGAKHKGHAHIKKMSAGAAKAAGAMHLGIILMEHHYSTEFLEFHGI